MSIEKEQFCFNCGESLGFYKRYHGDEPECCGKRECTRELRDQMAAEEADRRDRAESDHYGRY